MEPEDGETRMPSEEVAPSGEEAAPAVDAAAPGAVDAGEHPHDAAPPADDDLAAAPFAERHIEIDLVEGDLHVLGGAAQVLLSVDDDDLDDDVVEEAGGTLRFRHLPDGIELRVPDGAHVRVRQVYGDLRVEHLDGYIQAQRVGGDAELEQVAVAELTQVNGDVEARGGGSLSVRGVSGDLEISDYDEAPLIGHVSGDLDARNMPGLDLRESVGGGVELDRCGGVSLAGSIGGDLHAVRSTVSLRATAVGGDVELDTINLVTLASAGGDLRIENAAGVVEISSVGGDAEIRSASGRIRLGRVGGDLMAENAEGGINVGQVGGDAKLDTPLGAGAEYTITTGGDIELRVRGEVNARFVAQTHGGEIRTRLPLAVERGRRRNLVGVIGRGEATVTLRSGGDIRIATEDRYGEANGMSDDFDAREQQATGTTDGDEQDSRTWEGSLGRHRFRVRMDRGPGRAHVHFKGPFTAENDPDGMGAASRDFNVDWEKGRGARVYGEYEEKLGDLADKAQKAARKAAEQAEEYAERAARRIRETDWESVGREVRNTIERAMGDLEDAFSSAKRDWDRQRSGRPSSGSGDSSASGSRPTGAQRVRIEYDDPDAQASAAPNADDAEAKRRDILELLRSGSITLDEAERRLNDLR